MKQWVDPRGDRWQAVTVGTGRLEGWTQFVRFSAPLRPNKSEWRRGPDAAWRELAAWRGGISPKVRNDA